MANNLSIHQHPIYLLWIMLFSRPRKQEAALSALPALAEGFRLVKELDSGELIKPHRIGIYKNKLGQKAVVKLWTGKNKTFDAHSLEHEISMTILLQKVHKRILKKLSPDLLHVNTPRLIAGKVNREGILMMSEFKSGRLLTQVNNRKQISEYKFSLRYLKALTKGLTGNEKKFLPKRKINDYLFLYPALLIAAGLRQPKYIGAFLRGIPSVLSAFIKIRKQALGLVHRDLHTKNILVSDKQTAIIDLQRLVLTYPQYELVTTLATEWKNRKFRDCILDSVNTGSLKIFRGLMIHFATHALTANNLPRGYLTRYKAMLKFALDDFWQYYKTKI